MKHLFRSHMIQRPRLQYRAALVALAVVATLMMMTSMTAHASPLTPPTLKGTEASGTVTPNTASGCNRAVCILVVGTGLFVNYVNATGTSTSRNGCVKGQMLVRGSVREQTNPVCWLNPPNTVEHLSAHFPVGYDINNGSKVCVKFVGLGAPSGEPCETIHS